MVFLTALRRNLKCFLLYAKTRKEQMKIEYYLSTLVAMDFKRPIVTFFIAANYTITEVYHEKI